MKKEDSSERQYLSPRQAAQILGVSVETVYNMISRGDLQARKMGNAKNCVWRIPRKDVEAK